MNSNFLTWNFKHIKIDENVDYQNDENWYEKKSIGASTLILSLDNYWKTQKHFFKVKKIEKKIFKISRKRTLKKIMNDLQDFLVYSTKQINEDE